MPYRIDLAEPAGDALDRLVDLGALDVEALADGRLAALLPDGVPPDRVATRCGAHNFTVSAATGRDSGSVWVLSPRPIRIGRVRIVPAPGAPGPGEVRLFDGPAFGTGLHPTTALCVEAVEEAVDLDHPGTVLDVGTGSGVLALAALTLGVPSAFGIDIDAAALDAAAANARANGVAHRLRLARGGPEAVGGAWPLVVANVLAAPLIEMAPSIAGRLGHRARLILSGIPSSVEDDVRRAYQRIGLRGVRVLSRDGWVALVLQAPW